MKGNWASFVGTSRSKLRRALRELRQFLDTDESLPASQRPYALYHRSFADFLLDEDRSEDYWCEEQEQHKRIVNYYQERYADHWAGCDEYGLRHLPAHLVSAGRVDLLRQLLANFGWLHAKLSATDIGALIAGYDLYPQ